MDQLGYLGHVAVGGTLPLALQCYDAAGAPAAPDAAPLYDIYPADFTAPNFSGALGETDTGGHLGFRTGLVEASAENGFSAGVLYSVRLTYKVATSPQVAQATFEVV